jgi:hypothetical protein
VPYANDNDNDNGMVVRCRGDYDCTASFFK